MDCPQGHPNPTSASFCSTCGSALRSDDAPSRHSEPARPGHGRRSWTVVAVALALVVVGAAAAVALRQSDDPADQAADASSQDSAPSDFDVSGTFVLHGTGDESYGWEKSGAPCEGQEGYSDIVEGAQVVIKNSAGEQIALGGLGPGRTVEDDEWYQCHFDFTIPDVPVDGAIYSVEVTHRGSVSFSQDQADSLALDLGN